MPPSPPPQPPAARPARTGKGERPQSLPAPAKGARADRRAPPVGHRIRAARKARGMTQVALAEAAGISPAYLNMIEHNRRPIAGGLLLRLAAALDLPPGDLTGTEEGRLLAELRAAATDPVFAEAPLDVEVLPTVMGVAPGLLHAVLRLYTAYRRSEETIEALSEHVEALSERVSQDPFLAQASHRVLTTITSIRSFAEILQDYGDMDETQRQRFLGTLVGDSRALTDIATEMFSFLDSGTGDGPEISPARQVDDLLDEHGNHFPGLEETADRLRWRIDRSGGLLLADLLHHLEQRHRVTVRRVLPDSTSAGPFVWDAESRTLHLSRALPAASARFLTARLVARLDAAEEVDQQLAGARLTTPEARQRAREALLSYTAAALVFPYDAVLEAALELRYDIDLLQQRFAASWEQMCQRLTTLRRPGSEGIPLHFLRTDIAGNISKRFSASGMPLPRFGGACPRWVVHGALLTPGQVQTQVSQLPDGSTHLSVARTVDKAAGGYRSPRSVHSVMIGCDIAYAGQMVYGDGINLAAAADHVPVGVSCRQCPREPCAQRAHPAATPLVAEA